MSPTQSHAAPLRAVDEVQVDQAGTGATGRKRVDPRDPYLSGHYPDFTIYPGVFMLESVVQTTRRLVAARHGAAARAELTRIVSLRFTAPLLAGDELSVGLDCPPVPAAELAAGTPLRAVAKCRRGDGTPAASMTLEFAVSGAAGA